LIGRFIRARSCKVIASKYESDFLGKAGVGKRGFFALLLLDENEPRFLVVKIFKLD
jgi:hypothetical protein